MNTIFDYTYGMNYYLKMWWRELKKSIEAYEACNFIFHSRSLIAITLDLRREDLFDE